MSNQKITKRLVDGLQPRASEFILWDSELSGFGVRVRPSGHMTYIVQYRAGSGRSAPNKKLTIGAVTKLAPDEARSIARRGVAAVMNGQDPAQERAERKQAPTVRTLVKEFMEHHVEAKRKPATVAFYKNAFDLHILPRLGDKKAIDVTKGDVGKMHRDLIAKPTTANRAVDILSSLYGWAAGVEMVPEGTNPTRKLERYPEEGRERFLSAEEYMRLGATMDEAESVGLRWEPDPDGKTKHAPKDENRVVKFSPYVVAAIRLFLFTGARLREILHMRWDEYDPSRGVVFVPDSKTGKKLLVLSEAATAVIDALPVSGTYIIAGQDPNEPRADLKRPWARIRKHAGLDDVRLHDLRHSFASVGVGGGYGLPIVGKLLGHTQARTTQKYAHLDTEPMRRVTDEIGRRISSAIRGGTKAKPFAHAAGEAKAPSAKRQTKKRAQA